MNVNVIEVKGLGKKYRIGKAEKKSETLVGSIVNGLKQPLENLRKIRSLTKLDDEDNVVWALRDVSFEVKQGEVLGIIGHNGAGKSTLLKILSRITEPSVGEVHIKGRVAALLEVGTGFHPELTGRENIYMNGTILGMRKREIDMKLEEIVDFSGVEKFLDTPVKFYSSGMRVRLGFSVAAHLEPEILIVDEVLSVGDAEFQKKCLGKMENVASIGRTVLFVSHNLNAVKSFCPSSMLLEGGKKVMLDSSDTIVNHYLKKLGSAYSWKPLAKEVSDAQRQIFLRSIDCSLHQAIPLNTAFSIKVQLDFSVHQDDPVHVNLFFKSEGETAFVVSSQQFAADVGIYELDFQFPQHLFNNLTYQIDVMVIQRATGIINEKDVLTIDFIDTREVGWRGKFPGYVRPGVNTELVKL